MINEITKIRNNIRAITDNPITIVAASKTVSVDKINALPSCGITIAGENRVQELVEKYDKVSGVEWHLIGSLQTNKVKYIIDKVSLIHSVDRASLADEIDKQAAKIDKVMNVLVEINMGREPNKSGVMPEGVYELIDYVVGKKNMRFCGIMAVFPVGAQESLYAELQNIAAVVKQKYGTTIVSAGMSNDYQTAIKYGANMIRLGSAIFGARKYN